MRTSEEVSAVIMEEYSSLLQDNGVENPDKDYSTILLTSGLDSLGFAVLVTRLENRLGFDPFTMDPNPIYPKTLGDFISFYVKWSS